MRKLVIEELTGKVINAIEIKEASTWSPPIGFYLLDKQGGEIGDTWDGINFIKPPQIQTDPPHSTHISTLEAVVPTKARPAKVKRVWEGRDYFYDCFATQTVKDEYVAGKIKIGDYVLVHYDDTGEQIILAKVWKSW